MDNVGDMFKRGRDVIPDGEAHPRSKLTEAQVRAIIASNADAHTLASKYDVNVYTIKAIFRGDSWNCVTGLPHRRARKYR